MMSERHESGSAEAATSPSRGPINPKQETVSNEAEHSRIVAAFASQRRIAAALERLSDTASLSGLSLSQIRFLNDALGTMEDVSDALMSAPRFFTSEDGLSPSGEVVVALRDLVANYRDILIHEARCRLPRNVIDAESQAEVVLRGEIRDLAVIEEIAAAASDAQRFIADLRKGAPQ